MYGANITVVGRYSSAHQVVAWFFVSLHFHSAFLEYSTLCCLSFFFLCFPISICLKCISVQQRLALPVFFFFCSAVIDENELETTEHHEVRMKNIRWHLAEGIFALLF
jgi:hypothetical protein